MSIQKLNYFCTNIRTLFCSCSDPDSSTDRNIQSPGKPQDTKVTQTALARLLTCPDVFVYSLAFLDMPTIQKIGLANRYVHALTSSPQLWNIQCKDLQYSSKKRVRSLYRNGIFRDSDETISAQEKRAFHIYSTVLRNLTAFFTAFSLEKHEYPILISKMGEISFLQGIEAKSSALILVTKESKKINIIFNKAELYYQNYHAPRNLFSFGVIETNAKHPNQEGKLKYRARFIREKGSGIQHEVMFQFLRILNTAVIQRKTNMKDLQKGFSQLSISEPFEDVTQNALEEITNREQKVLHRESISLARLLHSKEYVRLAYQLCNTTCPEQVFQKLPLPLFENKFLIGEIVVVQRSDATYRYGFIMGHELKYCCTMFGKPYKEFIYSVLVEKKMPFADSLLKTVPAGCMYRIPLKVIKELLQSSRIEKAVVDEPLLEKTTISQPLVN